MACRISDFLFVGSCDRILNITCVMHNGRYEAHSPISLYFIDVQYRAFNTAFGQFRRIFSFSRDMWSRLVFSWQVSCMIPLEFHRGRGICRFRLFAAFYFAVSVFLGYPRVYVCL